jgi:hypothetical protein
MSGDDDDKPARPMGKGTQQIEFKKIDAEIEAKRIEAELEAQRIALASKKLDVDDHDKARDDRRATIRTILLWVTAFVGTVLALLVIGLAIYYGRSFDFSGFGFNASTTNKDLPAIAAPAPSEDGPEAPVDTDADLHHP